MTFSSAINTLKGINPWKTIYFNFHYFKLATAIRMPVFIFWRSKLSETCGKIVINAPAKTGMVKFGPYNIGIQDAFYSRTIWQVSGTVIIEGKVCIGRGSSICVAKDGTLKLGDNFIITGGSTIICQKDISFGMSCLLSWDILMMDTDFHNILDKEGEIINNPQPIRIGSHVWIGCRNTILKGVTIASNNVISANSTITKDVIENNCVIGGHAKGAIILKRNIDWG